MRRTDMAYPGRDTDGPGDRCEHLVLIVGIGGLPAPEALRAARSVTRYVSVLFVTAWADPAPLREIWQLDAAGGGEFLEVPNLEAAVDSCVRLHDRLPVDGVVTYSELLLKPQAEIAARLGLPGNSPESVATAQSKARQRIVFATHGVPSPRHARLRDDSDVFAAVEAIGLPAVFKPSLGAGSRNVTQVGTVSELTRAYHRARQAPGAFLQGEDVFLLEEPMPVEGADDSPYADYVSVESLLFEGAATHVAISDRLRLRHGYVEEGLVIPTRLGDDAAKRVTDCAERALRAVGLTHGATHTEIALTPDGPRVIEVNARAGGPTPTMLQVAAGYDFAAEIARVALGQPPGPPPQFTAVAWFRFMPIPAGSWRVTSQRTADEARQRFPELKQLSLRFRPGQTALRSNTQHLASFTVQGMTAREANDLAAAVESFLAITLAPLDSPGDQEAGCLRERSHEPRTSPNPCSPVAAIRWQVTGRAAIRLLACSA
jgi:biotin carboxylase